MADDSWDDRDLDPSADSLEEWLADQAKREGVSEEELFQRLLSSYWTLNEVTQLLQSADEDNLFGGSSDRGPPSSNTQTGDKRSSSSHQRESESDVGSQSDEDFNERLGLLEAKLEAQIERGTELESQLRTVVDRIEAFETEIAEHESATLSELRQFNEELDAIESEVTDEQARIESRLDNEFEDLETILDHLLTTTDSLESQIDRIERQQRSKTDALQSALEELQVDQLQLQRVMQDAAEIDTTTATCDNCEETIDLPLLTTPECYNCGRRLTGIEEETKWFLFGNPVAQTTESRSDRRNPPEPVQEETSRGHGSPHTQTSETTEHSSDDRHRLDINPGGEDELSTTGNQSDPIMEEGDSSEERQERSMSGQLPEDIQKRLDPNPSDEVRHSEEEDTEDSKLVDSFDWQEFE
ncbi:hypothetical protein [Halobaculum sp. EA56]|uniref:hypothetical protein n=1 Tax=Halobaculum sp. EA56 TaxID=3421648 RepID=UPI003EC0453F